jgi:hypothetical protein
MKVKGLEQLGFTRNVDFVVQDDGNGPYLKDWYSKEPKPTQADVDVAWVEAQQVADAAATAKANRIASVKSKLEALGLTTEEVQDAFGI